MALLTIKPSRGTVAFFVLLALCIAGRSGWHKHEATLVARATPPVRLARQLLRCVAGRDVQRVLGPRGLNGAPSPWNARLDDRLRRIVWVEYGPTWPARCVPLADRLVGAFRAAGQVRAGQFAAETARILADAARDPLAAITQVESGSLGAELTGLALETSAFSLGAEESWQSSLPPAPTDLYPLRMAAIPSPPPLPPDVDYATLVLPDLVLYQSATDRRLHSVVFDASERRTDRALGPGAPVRGAVRAGAALVADDAGDAVFLPGAEPAQIELLPTAVRQSDEALGDWQVALTANYLWLLTNDRGVLRVRTTPRAGDGRWGPPVASLGVADAMLGGVLLPTASDGEAVTVAAVRRTASGVRVENWRVTAAPGATATPRAAAAPGEPAVVPTAAAPSAVLVAGGGQGSSEEWPAFDPHMTSCAAGSVRYLVVAAYQGLSVVAVRDADVARRELRYADVGAAATGRFDVSCTERGVLVFADLTERPGTLVYFDFDPARSPTPVQPLAPPRFGGDGRVVGAAVTDRGVVALLDNGATIRAYTARDPVAGVWSGGALIAMLPQDSNTRAPDDASHGFRIGALAAHGDQVAALAEFYTGQRWVVMRLASRDGGATWR